MVKQALLFIVLIFFSFKGISQTTLFTETFESASTGTLTTGGTLSGWKMYQTTASVNEWTISTASFITGSKSLVVSNNGGTNAQYTVNDDCDKIAFYATLIDASTFNSLTLDFKWKCNGQINGGNYNDYGAIVYSLDGTTWYELSSSYYQGQTTTQTVSNLDFSLLDYQQFYIGFKWINNTSTGNNPGMIVDDITLKGVKEGGKSIGSPSSTNQQYQPFNAWWGYTRSQSIYTSAEIGKFGTITKVKYYVKKATATAIPIKIYLKTTTSNTTTTTDSWTTSIVGATTVLNTSLTFNTAGWYTIDITDFSYTSDNLMILIESNYTGAGTSASNSPEFSYTSATNLHSIWEQDNTLPDANAPSIRDGLRPNVIFLYDEFYWEGDVIQLGRLQVIGHQIGYLHLQVKLQFRVEQHIHQ
jgi:hypothetical protein